MELRLQMKDKYIISLNLHNQGMCIQGICYWGEGVCLRGYLHPWGSASGGRASASRGLGQTSPIMTSSGGNCSSRYASYWNAFLLHMWIDAILCKSEGYTGTELHTQTMTLRIR